MNRNNMKKIYILVAIFSTAMLTSCDSFLDKEPLTDISPSKFWKTETDLQQGVNILYNQMYDGTYSDDNRSLDAYGQSPDNTSSGTYSIPNTDDVYTNCYKMIRVSNYFLENYENATVSETLKNRYAGEARFFRAYNYFLLTKRFGDVIYVTSSLNMDSELLYGSRTDKATIIDGMIEDLQFAVQNLPEKSKASDKSRVTKGVANGLLARICLYYGTWYKYHQGDATLSKKYLALAQSASAAIIDSNEYSLDPNYNDMFLLENAYTSPETMLAYRYTTTTGFNYRVRASVTDFSMRPTKFLADAFLCKDGLPINKSSYKVEYLPIASGTEFNNRDPRMSATLWRPGSVNDWVGKPLLPDFGSNTKTGYLYKKYSTIKAYNTMAQYIDEILMRYGEVLLTYAEATYELNGKITDEELNKSINKLRQRWSSDPDCLPNLTNDFVASHGLDMREEIRRERRVELAAEFFRYDDIIRWATADKELPQTVLGIKFDKNAYPNINITAGDLKLNADGFVIVQDGATRQFNAKDWIYPLPLREVSLNKNLKQNEGWN